MKFIIKLLVAAVSVILVDYLLSGIYVDSFGIAVIVAILLGIFNATLKPLLIILTIPVTVFTLGLFLIVINAAVVLLVDWLVPGFHVDSFWWAVGFSLILSFISSFLETSILGEKKNQG